MEAMTLARLLSKEDVERRQVEANFFEPLDGEVHPGALTLGSAIEGRAGIMPLGGPLRPGQDHYHNHGQAHEEAAPHERNVGSGRQTDLKARETRAKQG
jgi:hypothetical protein